jgi:hypothetical protein
MVEFNLVALDKLAEYNVLWDLNAYKALMNVFPKERLKPQSFWQAELMHYPKRSLRNETFEFNGPKTSKLEYLYRFY